MGFRTGGDEYEYKEVEEVDPNTNQPITVRNYLQDKALVSVKDAFPKIVHLNAKVEANTLDVSEL